MSRKLLVADLLCGAGGSSTGCKHALDALGLEMELVCVDHWPTVIETHRRNHPEARHYVQDIATVRPHLLVPEGYLDLLMASPTCTHHSRARGGKPTSDQQRSDPWHIITWLTELRVKRIIIENVWEFTGWGPVDPKTGKPIKARKGEYFNAWIETLRRLGFDPAWRKLNAADYGDATTRQRFILMARSDGRRIFWPSPTHQRREGGDLFAEKPWRPAREIIDWSIKGKSIFTRPKPLAPRTLARIYAGAVKFDWPQPFLVILRNHMAAQGMDNPLPTIAAGGNHIGIAEPVVVSAAHGVDAADPNPHGRRVKSIADPLGAIHAGGGNFAVAEPVIMNGRKGNQPKGVSTEPVPTLDTKGGVWLAEPIRHNPLCSIHTGRQGYRCDYDCARDYPQAIVLSQHNSGAPRTSADPLPTITTGGAGAERREGCARPMLIDPFVLSRQGEGAPRSTEEPTPTQVAKHSHLLITSYYGASQNGAGCTGGDDPLPTVTAKDRFGMVVPVTHSQGGNSARDVSEPVPPMTTAKGGEFALVHGNSTFLVPEDSPAYDILFRMLEPHELSAAMGLEDYDFAGTKTEKIKQIGNAVSRRKMQACVTAIVADEAPKGRAAAPVDYQEAAE